jgi:hypothetical protein
MKCGAEMGGACMGKKCIKDVCREPEEMSNCIPKCTWKDNIKINLTAIGWDRMDHNDLAQDSGVLW